MMARQVLGIQRSLSALLILRDISVCTIEAALEQIARHTFQSKASIMRRFVQDGVKREAEAYAEGAVSVLRAASILSKA